METQQNIESRSFLITGSTANTLHSLSSARWLEYQQCKKARLTEVIANACHCAIDLETRQAQIVCLTAGIFAILMNPYVSPSLLLFRW